MRRAALLARLRQRHRVRVLVVGALSLLVALGITGGLGRAYAGREVLTLLSGMAGGLQFLGSAIFTALATILALTLTSVSFLPLLHAERLVPNYLQLVRQCALLAILGMGLSLVLVLVTLVPSAQDQTATDARLLAALYYAELGLVSVLVGAVMMLMFLLLDAIDAVLGSLPRELVERIESVPPPSSSSPSSPARPGALEHGARGGDRSAARRSAGVRSANRFGGGDGAPGRAGGRR